MRLPLVILLAALPACSPQPAPETRTASPEARRRAPSVDRTEPPSEPRPGNPPASQPPARKNVTLRVPQEGVAITANPMTISGTARTFENHVSIRIRDEEGIVIARAYATAAGDLGSFNPWSTEVFLTSHPGRRLQVEAFDVSAKDGSEQSLVRVESPYEVERKTYRIFFPDSNNSPADCSVVKAFEREMPVSRSAARLVVEALLDGPTASSKLAGATALFPEGTEVRSIAIRNATAIVDLNERAENVGGACRAQAIRAALEQSLMALGGIRKVEVRAMGSAARALQP
jgi:hypothetical protein